MINDQKRRADQELYDNIKEIATMKADLRNTIQGVSEIKQSLFGDKGIEGRLRKVERQQGFIAGGAAVLSICSGFIVKWFK